MKKPIVNPRLTSKLKQQRELSKRLEAFQRCERALAPFDDETQCTIIRAVVALRGYKIA